jgi:hypothetical protein
MTKEEAMDAYLKETRRVNNKFLFLNEPFLLKMHFHFFVYLGSFNGTKK